MRSLMNWATGSNVLELLILEDTVYLKDHMNGILIRITSDDVAVNDFIVASDPNAYDLDDVYPKLGQHAVTSLDRALERSEKIDDKLRG